MAQCTSAGGKWDVTACEQCQKNTRMVGFFWRAWTTAIWLLGPLEMMESLMKLWIYEPTTMMEYTSAIYHSWLEIGQKICFLVDLCFVPGRHLTLPEGRCPLLISSYFFCSPYLGAMVRWWWGRWFLILRLPNGHSMKVTITPETYIT